MGKLPRRARHKEPKLRRNINTIGCVRGGACADKKNQDREKYIVALISGAIGAIATSIISIPAQYYLTSHQINEEFSSWQRKEISKLDLSDYQRKRELIREVRELHEQLLAADTLFAFASELLAFQNALENYKDNLPLKAQMRIDNLFSRLTSKMGINEKSSYFAVAAQNYVDKKARLVSLLTEMDLYFSSEAISHANAYYRNMNASTMSATNRALHWDQTARQVASAAANGEIDAKKLVDDIYKDISSVISYQAAYVYFYNKMYDEMRAEMVSNR